VVLASRLDEEINCNFVKIMAAGTANNKSGEGMVGYSSCFVRPYDKVGTRLLRQMGSNAPLTWFHVRPYQASAFMGMPRMA
jgi:hypothetical protein